MNEWFSKMFEQTTYGEIGYKASRTLYNCLLSECQKNDTKHGKCSTVKYTHLFVQVVEKRKNIFKKHFIKKERVPIRHSPLLVY